MTRRSAVATLAAAAGPAFSLLLHLPFFLPGRSAGFRDLVSTHEPLRTLVTGSWLRGEVPHWNPFPDGGAPLLANPNAGVLHPSLLTSFLFEPALATTLAVVLQQMLAALAVFGLARRWGAGRSGAAVASMIWAGAGPVLSVGTTLNQLNGFAWAPVAAWAVGWAARHGGLRLLAGAAAVAAVALAGAPLALGTVLLFVLLELLVRPTNDVGASPEAAKSPGWRPAARSVAALAGGVALAGPALWPAALLVGRAERAAGFPAELALSWSLHPLRLLELVVPMPLGNPAYVGPPGWLGNGAFDGGLPLVLSVFVGAPALLLVLHGLRQGRRAAALGVSALAMILVALGRHAPFYDLLVSLPGVPPLRYPSKFLLPACLALAILAGLGWSRLLADGDRRRGRQVAWGAAAATATVALLVLLVPPGHALVRAVAVRAGDLGTGEGVVVAWMRGQALLAAGFLTLALFAPLLMGRRRGYGVALLGGALVASLVTGAWGITDGRLDLLPNPAVSSRILDAPHLPAYREALAAAAAPPGRLLRLPGARGQGLVSPRLLREEIYERSRWTLRHHGAALAGVGTVLEMQPDRLGLFGPAALRSRFASMTPEARAAAARRLGVAAVESFGDPGLTSLPPIGALPPGTAFPPLQIRPLGGPVPAARLVGGAFRATDDQQAFELLLAGGLDPQAVVILSDGPGAGPLGRPGPVGRARLERIGLNALRIELDASRDGWLVLTENWDRGWDALLDGRPAPLRRADLLVRAIRVPAGRHEVALTYRSPGWRAGCNLALGSLAVLLALALADRRMGP